MGRHSMNDVLKDSGNFLADLWYFITHFEAREIVTALVIIAITTVVAGVILGSIRWHAEFMEQCMVDHKEYVCTLMYRDGLQGTAIVPMVIPGMSQ